MVYVFSYVLEINHSWDQSVETNGVKSEAP